MKEAATLHKLSDHSLLLLLVATLGLSPFLYFAPRLNIDISADSLVLKNDPDLAYYRAIQARYGTRESLIVAYQPEAGLFSRKPLTQLKALKSELEQLQPITGVTSIFFRAFTGNRGTLPVCAGDFATDATGRSGQLHSRSGRITLQSFVCKPAAQ